MHFFAYKLLACAVALTGLPLGAATVDFQPADERTVVEQLAPRVRVANRSPQAAAASARQAIVLARETSDPRYLGRAQALLAPWWDKPDAPPELAVLQATVLQSRHAFAAARTVLQQALQRDPGHAQGWITLATLERVAARYPQAQAACAQVARAGASLYAAACQLETRSLLGFAQEAQHGLEALRRQAQGAATQAWLLSLQAEHLERAGDDTGALAAYRASLALAGDSYTALAAADLLLRTRQAPAALAVLAAQPESDAVLLRRARAHQLLDHREWKTLAAQLQERFAALEARGDAPVLHARERALASLWLEGQPVQALVAARLNLSLQKEPLDWWLALQAAQQAGDWPALAEIQKSLAGSGLRDARLAQWQNRGRT